MNEMNLFLFLSFFFLFFTVVLRSSRRSVMTLFHIFGSLNDTNDIIALGEEYYPVVERLFLLILQVMPLSLDIFWLGRRLAKGP